MAERGKRSTWLMGAFCLATACSDPAPPSATAPDTTDMDPPAPTAETLLGAVDARGDGSVDWVRTFPGDVASPPKVFQGPGDELIVLLNAERRPHVVSKLLSDLLLLRLDANTGELRWLKVVEPNVRVALDTQGNIILAKHDRLQKLDADGKLLWDKPRATGATLEPISIAVDGNDDLLLARLERDQTAGETNGDATGFVTLEKLDSAGEPVWSSRFGDGTSEIGAFLVTVDADNDLVVLAAGLKGPFDFGGGTLDAENVVAKYDASGNHVFSKAFDDLGPVGGYHASSPVLTDADNDIFLRTESTGPIDIGLGELFCFQYVIKLDQSGEPIWNVCAHADELALLPDGGFVTTHSLYESMKVGEQQCDVPDTSDNKNSSLARYDADGNWIATRCAADPGYQYIGAPLSGGSDKLLLTAAFGSQFSLPDGSAVLAIDDQWTAMVAKVALPAP